MLSLAASRLLTRTCARRWIQGTVSFRFVLPAAAVTPHLANQSRFFSKKRKKVKQKARQKRKNERRKWYSEDQARIKRMKNLHPAAKMKRIISACDFWFSNGNLSQDSFFLDELRDYQGWVRVSTLADFPKLEGWCDQNLIVNALKNEAVSRRYQVVFHRELVEKATLNRRRRQQRKEIERKREEMDRKKVQKEYNKWRKDRMKKLERDLDETRGKWFLSLYKEDLYEGLKYDQEELAKEKQECLERQKIQLEQQWPSMTSMKKAVHLVRSQIESAKDGIFPAPDPREEEMEEERKEIEGYTEADIDWGFYCESEDEFQLQEENEKFKEAVIEFERLEEEIENEQHGSDWEWRQQRLMEREFGYIEGQVEDEKKKKEGAYFETLGLKDDGKSLKDEELPKVIQDDGSNLLMYALVRHKRVNLEYLSNLTKIGELETINDGDDEFMEEYGWGYNLYNTEDFSEWGALDEEKTGVENNNSQPKKKNLQKYSSSRELHIITKSTKLASFCQKLRESVARSQIKAIGFDVEYCTLEMNIRNTLPAILQLASPESNGPVGLIWLDKFPNHGKDMIGDDDCKDLLSILSDYQILKVGPSVSKDAKHLANWWGITDKKFVSFYCSGATDLEEELDDRVRSKSLKEMCANVLERDLPKLKEKGAKRKKEKRKKGKHIKTSHWRRDELTKEMKKYAADDASCAIDVWKKMQEEEE